MTEHLDDDWYDEFNTRIKDIDRKALKWSIITVAIAMFIGCLIIGLVNGW